MTSCAAFRKESRMKFASATKLDRKSGVAQWRDLRFLFLCLRQQAPRLLYTPLAGVFDAVLFMLSWAVTHDESEPFCWKIAER